VAEEPKRGRQHEVTCSTDGQNSIVGQHARRPFGTCLLASILVFGVNGCTVLDWVDKKKPPEVPGEEQARLERLKKEGGGSLSGRPASRISATPESVDFGDARIDVESQHAIVFSNPSPFTVTVVKVTIDGAGFAWSNQGLPLVIPARGQLALTITFRPAEPNRYSAALWLEIDSAGGRFTRVLLKGRGVRRMTAGAGSGMRVLGRGLTNRRLGADPRNRSYAPAHVQACPRRSVDCPRGVAGSGSSAGAAAR
jgi:hypothetical protein